MQITKITILQGTNGPDCLMLHTILPEGCFPYKGNATAKIEVAAGGGLQYAEKHFPNIEIKIIKV